MTTTAPIVRRSFVLHSGGLDSSTALVMAMRQAEVSNLERLLILKDPECKDNRFVLDDVVSISISYGQRHSKEIAYAAKLCKYLKVQHKVVHMPEPPPSMLTDPSVEIPHQSYAELPKGISPTYVPFRNGQLLSRITGLAQGWIMEQEALQPKYSGDNILQIPSFEAQVWFGAHAEDAQNWAYPDCTPEFIGAMANAIYIGTYMKVRLITPFTFASKDEIVTYGESQGLPYDLTWSCYAGEELHCGECPTCLARKEAFIKADIEDPTRYASDPSELDDDDDDDDDDSEEGE